jgi:hypothetical protein
MTAASRASVHQIVMLRIGGAEVQWLFIWYLWPDGEGTNREVVYSIIEAEDYQSARDKGREKRFSSDRYSKCFGYVNDVYVINDQF